MFKPVLQSRGPSRNRLFFLAEPEPKFEGGSAPIR